MSEHSARRIQRIYVGNVARPRNQVACVDVRTVYADSGEVVRADTSNSVSSRATRKRRIVPDELFGQGVAEAYRRAGSKVHLLRERVEQRRLALRIDGADPWCLPSCLQVQALCAWNAFALQILGEALLEPEGAPHSHGTATQALALFAEVETWLSYGLQAADNEQFVLDRDVPASLPVGGSLSRLPRPSLP